jgi:hypothetical protein
MASTVAHDPIATLVMRKSTLQPARHQVFWALTPKRFAAIYGAMKKLRSAASTTTATAHGGSPPGYAR